MTQERTRKLGSPPEVTWQQKTSSRNGLSFSLLFPDMKSLYIYFGKKKKEGCSHILHVCLCPSHSESFLKIFIN